MKNKFLLPILSTLLLFTGCNETNMDDVSHSQVGVVQQTYRGVVTHKRLIKVASGEHNTRNGALIGGAAGAGIGALASENIAGTVVGGALGAVAGSMIGEGSKSTKYAYEYRVKLSNGNLVTIVQSIESDFYIGQAVYLTQNGAHSRLSPA